MKALSLSLIFFVCFGCVSVRKELDRGRYKEAISLAVSKLKGKKKKSPEHVLALEEAHKYYLQEKLTEAENLEKKGENEAELQLLKIYEEIDNVQAGIRPLLPLADKHGYKADIHLADISLELAKYRKANKQ